MITKETVENYIDAIINLAENSEDIVEAARLSSCLTLHFNSYYNNVQNPTRSDNEFTNYAGTLLYYKTSAPLLSSRHRFLSHHINIRYDKETEYHMCEDYREAFTKIYEKVTGRLRHNSPLFS